MALGQIQISCFSFISLEPLEQLGRTDPGRHLGERQRLEPISRTGRWVLSCSQHYQEEDMCLMKNLEWLQRRMVFHCMEPEWNTSYFLFVSALEDGSPTASATMQRHVSSWTGSKNQSGISGKVVTLVQDTLSISAITSNGTARLLLKPSVTPHAWFWGERGVGNWGKRSRDGDRYI